MDMMDIASMAMQMSGSRFEQSYGAAIAKKAMNAEEEMAAKMVNDMLPQVSQIPQVPKGEFLDVYA